MTKTRWIVGLAALFSAATAHAEEGTVIAIDTDDLVLDIGTKTGVEKGQVVELWRPVRLKHPVTGKVLVDRFKIATLRLVDVENVLSLARVEQSSQRSPQAGDIVVVPTPKRADEPPKTALPPYNPAAPPAGHAAVVVQHDPEEEALADLFTRLKGADRATRILEYRAFIAVYPKSRFGDVLRQEIDALDPEMHREPPVVPAAYAPIDRLRPGTPQRFAVELDPRFVGAVVHVKARGASSYRSIPMESIGERYWSGTLPGDAIAEPAMDYFVEGTRADGTAAPVVGTATQPRDATVEARPLSGKREGTLATVAVSSELASFNVKKANDYIFQTEGAFGWRLEDIGIRAVRSGFGVLRGKAARSKISSSCTRLRATSA